MDLEISRGYRSQYKATGVHITTLPCGPISANCVVIRDVENKKAIIVDCGGDADKIVKEVEGYEVEYLIATHAHVDHVSGFKELQEKVGGKFCIHKEDVPLLSRLEEQCRMFMLTYYPPPAVDMEMKEGDVFTVGPVSFKVITTPGHSAGSICLYSSDLGLLLSGDTIFRSGVGRTDLPGGSFEKLNASIKKKLLTLPDSTVVITGHGDDTKIGLERRTQFIF